MTRSTRMYFSRALEGPIEATLELKDDLSEFLPTLIRTHLLILVVLCYFWLTFLIENIFLVVEVYKLIAVQQIPWDLELWVFFGTKGVFVFLFAISMTVLLFLVQSTRFTGSITGRYRIIESLSEQELNGAKVTDDAKDLARHSGDPIKSILDMLDDVNVQVPQLIRMYNITIFLLSLLPVFIAFSLFYTVLYGNLLGFSTTGVFSILGVANVILKLMFIVLCFVAIFMCYRSRMFFLIFQKRRAVINDVRFDMNLKVPSGKNEMERFVKYLKRHDPILAKDAGIWPLDASVKQFDGILKARTEKLSPIYSPGWKDAAVFIKVADKKVTPADVDAYAEDVLNYVKKNNVYPLRIALILKGKAASALDDELYDHILESPRFTLAWEKHYVQLVVEEDRQYSFIPNVASPP